MSKTIKILSIILMAIMLVTVVTPVFAFDVGTIVDEIEQNAESNANNNSELNTMAGKIVALIRNIAVIAGVILLSVIGIKFMMGSAEEKAEYKKSLLPLVIGIVVVMAASQIVTMIFNFVK